MKNKVENKYDSGWYLSKRLFTNYIRPLKRKLTLALLCMVITACTTAVSAWIIQPALDYIFIDKNYNCDYESKTYRSF